MECPVDGTELEGHTLRTVNVEGCSQCKGLWFEPDELRIAKDEAAPDLVWLDFDLWEDPDSFAAEWSSRKCPHCGGNLAALAYADTGVTVDSCPQGHGVWLDGGEFEALIQALEAEAETKDIPAYLSASLEEAKEILVGREGFISEWDDLVQVLRLLQYRVLAENPKLAELIRALQATSPF
jgi:Zn-finger nucleic acid-binding protein